MDEIRLTREEAREILSVLLECEEALGDEVELLFAIDGAVRILVDKLFGDLPDGEGGHHG